MQMRISFGTCARWCVAAAVIVGTSWVAAPTFAQTPLPANPPSVSPPTPVDLTKVPTLYEVGYSHLDTEWCWTYPQVVNQFIGDTLHQNFALFQKYPDYVFNWTGANRYKFMKEYYPVEYKQLKTYVAQGRWVNTGSSLEEGDVDIPSEESIVRQVLYGNEFFNNEFHSASSDFILPDCFGFPASLPSILAHCGINGFSTQKLDWGSAERTMGVNGIPFNLGVWVGPDNQSIFAALNGGGYGKALPTDASNDSYWIKRVNQDGAQTGIYADYNYYGTGDRGGSVRESDAQNLETGVHGTGPLRIVSARSDQVFNDLEKLDTSKMLRYKGDLLLTGHSSGSTTSQAEQKRWNHENEKLADATERASVVADWLGSLPYDKARITDGWWKFLPGQFHDLMAGTAIPLAYDYSWNDEVLALNEFAGQLQEAVGGTTRGLDTSGAGIPVIVYNPLSVQRQDLVTATVTYPGRTPNAVAVVSPAGTDVPSQVESRTPNSLTVLFLATVPSIGYSAYHVVPAPAAPAVSSLKVSTSGLENARYRVTLNSAGDVASIYDKAVGKELLSSPLRLAFQYENPVAWPAWNMDYDQQMAPAEGYVDGPAKISVAENGPARVAVKVDRWARGSHFVQTISLSAGQAGDRVEFANSIDWQTKQCALDAVIPLTASNRMATYNWELGTIERSTDDPLKYQVPSHQWFDLTDSSGTYGVTVLSGDRYGSDKPTDSTLRLTLVYTPGTQAGYVHEGTNDIGHHELTFALTGHAGSWTPGTSQWPALRFDRQLFAFQAQPHTGALGKSFSFVHLNTPNVSVEALKQAEFSKSIVVRFNELAGKSEQSVVATFPSPIVSAREVNGQEAPIGPATVKNGSLVFSTSAYRPRAYEITLAPPADKLSAPASIPLSLAYNVNVTKPFGSASGGSFDSNGNAIPADMLPPSLVSDGVSFKLAPANASRDAVSAKGQTIVLPNIGAGTKLYLLAASSNGDEKATFLIGSLPVVRTIEAWNGRIGSWDERHWGGIVPELSYNIDNPMIGLTPGYIKRDTVAWYSDHIRGADGVNQVYNYCYLYRYAFSIPAGAKSITLPNDSNIKVLAATIADNPDDAIVPAQPLYDTLQHPIDNAPHIAAITTADGDGVSVDITAPLYFSDSSTIHYTLDGATPTASSPAFIKPFTISQSTPIKAVYIADDGTVEGVDTISATVASPSAPQVVKVNSITSTALSVIFSEPVSTATAEDTSNYTVSSSSVTSAVLQPDAETVTLKLVSPLPSGQGTISVNGVQSAAANGLAVNGATGLPIPVPTIVYQADAVQSFDGTSNGVSNDVAGLPVSAGSSWTINLFAYFDSTPGELTTLAGFGDDTDTTGAERYITKFNNSISFWGSHVDVSTGVAYDLAKWQMVTATFDGKTLILYKNGRAIDSTPVTFTDAASTVKVAPLGPWADGSKLDGKIAGVRIWSTALSPDQVAGLLSETPQG